LSERCAERKNGNYHAWSHRQWVLQKAPNLLNYEIVKTEKFIRKNIADYSAYHHRYFVLTKLFDLQYFDLHDDEVNELYQFVNSGLADNAKINNVKDLALYLFPNVDSKSVNTNKLKSFIFTLNLALHDLKMVQDLIEIHGKYEAFNCYNRIIVKFAIDIVNLANNSDYLTYELFGKAQSCVAMDDGRAQSKIIERLFSQLDGGDALYKKIFF
jgi:protein prenyltransferase alpha subunit repeat containing protein 1